MIQTILFKIFSSNVAIVTSKKNFYYLFKVTQVLMIFHNSTYFYNNKNPKFILCKTSFCNILIRGLNILKLPTRYLLSHIIEIPGSILQNNKICRFIKDSQWLVPNMYIPYKLSLHHQEILRCKERWFIKKMASNLIFVSLDELNFLHIFFNKNIQFFVQKLLKILESLSVTKHENKLVELTTGKRQKYLIGDGMDLIQRFEYPDFCTVFFRRLPFYFKHLLNVVAYKVIIQNDQQQR